MDNPEIGMLVRIYQDPITKNDYEGLAKLVSSRKDDNGLTSIWLVEFISESGEYYQRTINHKDLIIE